MKNLFDVVEFYESIKHKNLFPNSTYSDDQYHSIESKIKEVNQEFFNLIFEQALENKTTYQAIQIVFNELESFFWEIDGEIKNTHIPNLEQTPLFKFKVKFEKSNITIAFSRILVNNGISDIYWYLEKHFAEKIKLSHQLFLSSYVPPYVDEIGYTRHIYSKFFQVDFLEKELYNHRNNWIPKIEEFLNYLPAYIKLSLPIELFKVKSQDFIDSEKNEISSSDELQHILDSCGFIIDNSDLFENLENIIHEESKKIIEKPLFKFSNPYTKEKSGNDYIADLFYLLRDSFELFDIKCSTVNFRCLFKGSTIKQPIEVKNPNKLLAVIKFLKQTKIIQPHQKYIKLMTDCFTKPNQKPIEIKTLYGSKYKLTFAEVKKIKLLFGINNSEMKK